jgi:hypothetical protein
MDKRLLKLLAPSGTFDGSITHENNRKQTLMLWFYLDPANIVVYGRSINTLTAIMIKLIYH